MAMTTYRGTREVEPGLYVNVKRFSMKSIDTRGPLPGTENDEYRPVPMLVMLAMAPLLGLAFVVFLPFIGFAMVTWLLGLMAAQAVGNVATAAVRVVRPAWIPALAFLTRSKPAEPDTPANTEPDAWEEGVEKRLSENGPRA
jgi:hypothetical protein